MARRISFAKTIPQIRAKTKTVTRRLGWDRLVAEHREAVLNMGVGVRLTAIEKGMGLELGEKQVVLCAIETVEVTRVRLDSIDQADCVAEGFPELRPAEFVSFFCREMGCKPTTTVVRIRFRYVEDE